MSAFENLRDALAAHGSRIENAGPDRFMAQCPGHTDGRPSLSVRRSDKGALIWCFAGCEPGSVLAPLGLAMRDLYDAERVDYSYTDRSGFEAFTVHRQARSKDFRQSGTTKWAKGTKPLYRLPDVVAAVSAGRPVYLTEGEKDADCLALAGMCATTTSGGASNPHLSDFAPLAGADVRIVPDQDKAGAGYTQKVRALLDGVASTVSVWKVKAGKDYADHFAAGYGLDDLTEDQGDDTPEGLRRVVLISAADIEPLPTTWTWEQRLPTGALGLIAGPEGTGKSTCAYWTVARITRGELPGIHKGRPKDVLIAATEDSWARTIVPRLIAAGADLGRVWRVEVSTVLGTGGYLTLPKDIGQLAQHARDTGAALLLLDPIMSRLEAGLDTHKDAETRRALEPIAALADSTGMSVLGLIHFNKGGSAEVLNNVMASKAFTAVARSVSTVIRDPNDDTGRTRIFGTPKSNLGRDDLPLLPFQLSEHTFRNKAGDLIVTSRIEWLDERTGTIDDLMRQARDTNADRSITAEVADWLSEYLHTEGDEAKRSQIVNAARKEQYSETHLRRAAEKLGIVKTRKGFPASSWWALPDEAQSIEPQSGHSPVTVRGECITDLTDLTEAQSSQSGQSGQSAESTREMTGLDSGGVRVCEFCHRPLTGNPCEECGATQHALTVIHEAGLVNDRTAAVIEITEMETSA